MWLDFVNGIFHHLKDEHLGKWSLEKYSEITVLRRLNLESFFFSDLPGEAVLFTWEDECYIEKQRAWCVTLTEMEDLLLWVRRDILFNPYIHGVFVAFTFMFSFT